MPMRAILVAMKPRGASFGANNGYRIIYLPVERDDVSHMPALSEPFLLWPGATGQAFAVTHPEDLAAAAPDIEAAVKAWADAPLTPGPFNAISRPALRP
jgi:hypothetical protein